MPVVDGQSVSAGVTNPAFLDAQVDDTAVGIISLANAVPASGAPIINTQGLQNHLRVTTGATETSDGTTYSSQTVITNGDNHQTALGKVDEKFHQTTGHAHTGVSGDAPAVASSDIAGVPLRGYVIRGTDFNTGGAPSTSTDVSALMVVEVASSGPTVQGVVVIAPDNRVRIRQGLSGPNPDAVYKDSFGNVVYGRLTFLAGVWTLSYFVDVSGVETAFSFPATSPLRWYFQRLNNAIVNAPFYSEFFFVPEADELATGGFSDGLVTSPSIYFLSSPSTGFFRESANVIGVTVNSLLAALLSSSGLTLANQKELRLRELAANGVNHIGFKAPASLAGNTDYTFPPDGSVGQLLRTDGLANLSWVSSTNVPGAGIYNAVVGSAAQVIAGVATHSSITAAIAAVATGESILVLPGTFTENVTVNKKVYLTGLGHGSVLNGTLTFSIDFSSFKLMRVADNVVFSIGADGNILNDCWLAATKTVTDNGTGNLVQLIQE